MPSADDQIAKVIPDDFPRAYSLHLQLSHGNCYFNSMSPWPQRRAEQFWVERELKPPQPSQQQTGLKFLQNIFVRLNYRDWNFSMSPCTFSNANKCKRCIYIRILVWIQNFLQMENPLQKSLLTVVKLIWKTLLLKNCIWFMGSDHS